jgi:hypothetical protein
VQHFYRVIDLKSNRANITRSWPTLRPRSEPLVRFSGRDDGCIAQGLFTPNRSHIVPEGLDAVKEALSLNKSGVSGRNIVIRPHSAKQ